MIHLTVNCESFRYCGKRITQDPDYSYIIGLFESCMKRHGFNLKTPDFIWNKNRLFLERQTLKESMMRVINKPAAASGAKPGKGAADERGGAQED